MSVRKTGRSEPVQQHMREIADKTTSYETPKIQMPPLPEGMKKHEVAQLGKEAAKDLFPVFQQAKLSKLPPTR
ncbi:MAG: hypothetical protein Tsb0015_00580 [Simkaniaceae bacterium]